MTGFALRETQVPDFPASDMWVDQIRWCLAVMNADDDDMGFLASLLAHACKGGLTEKQSKYAHRSIERIAALHAAGRLSCQVPD